MWRIPCGFFLTLALVGLAMFAGFVAGHITEVAILSVVSFAVFVAYKAMNRSPR